MQVNTYMNNEPSLNQEDMPPVISVMASLVRLMSCYIHQPSVSQAMTIVHIINYLEQHPCLDQHPEAIIASSQAKEIWYQQLNISGIDTSLH